MADSAKVVIDDENPEWTQADFAAARPGVEVLPVPLLNAFARKRGRPKVATPKVAVSLRLDPDVLAYFRGTGDGWQRRVNEALRKAMESPV